MKNIVLGILAHVDAGKTTLSESMLYLSGSIRSMGRVDKGNAFLDTFELERERGITIFSKQAIFNIDDSRIMLLDTPGHVDFSAEMERTLRVLDYAILVVSGADGVQGHTFTLWRLLREYDIPTFIFVNKMDQPGTDKHEILYELKKNLSSNCVDFSGDNESFYEDIAFCDEKLLDEFIENEAISNAHIANEIAARNVFPCYFGSALKLDGIDKLIEGIDKYTCDRVYQDKFAAMVYKIARDEQGNRLTYLKVTGGSLKVKALLSNSCEENSGEIWEEKVNQIRIYSGTKYEAVNEVEAGCICAVTGLNYTFPGEGLGDEYTFSSPFLEPVLTYKIILPDDCDVSVMLPKLKLIEEEDPELHIIWDENLKEIQAKLMGEVQIEVIKRIVKERFNIDIEFGTGNIVYKETIENTVEGVGHFEPLRHYAEVHLILEPNETGEGIYIDTDCSEDILDKNWQRLIVTHLYEKEHKGVLTGSPITDVKITLVTGRAHQKHTEGGDFRQATYRAVRQGLMQAKSVLLEPYYNFRLEIPENLIGRAMTDIDKMHGVTENHVTGESDNLVTISGYAPVICMNDYQKEVIAYTKGKGRLFFSLKGYLPCHNAEEVISEKAYNPENDLDNLAGSVFCAHGAGFNVSWDKVFEYMHMESVLDKRHKELSDNDYSDSNSDVNNEEWIGTDEIDRIIDRTFNANKKENHINRKIWGKRSYSDGFTTERVVRSYSPVEKKEEYLLVDGYNVVFAWDELNDLASDNIDGARGRLMDILCNYQAIKKCNLIVVFDAYRIKGHQTEISDYHNIHVVFTKEAETADQYIEKFAHENSKKYNVTVVTSDGLEQIIIRGAGCMLMSSREFYEENLRVNARLREEFIENAPKNKNYLIDNLSENEAKIISELKDEDERV